jgi:hypothetical protein
MEPERDFLAAQNTIQAGDWVEAAGVDGGTFVE